MVISDYSTFRTVYLAFVFILLTEKCHCTWVKTDKCNPSPAKTSLKQIKESVNELTQAVCRIEEHNEDLKKTMTDLLDKINHLSNSGVDTTTVVPMPTPAPTICGGTVIFRDDFSAGTINTADWEYEVSMYGGYNWEFQVYTNDPVNIFTKDGNLYIKPTLTASYSKFSEEFLTTGVMDVDELWGICTNSDNYGCVRNGVHGMLPPIMSGKLKSKHPIKYGRIEVRAKIPKGDWIWPAMWMLPESDVYGTWPRSGEIDLMESRGNTEANDTDGNNHGINKVSSSLHWGPDIEQNRYFMTFGDTYNADLWSTEFHLYSLDWTPDHTTMRVDDNIILNVPTPAKGFWTWGEFQGTNIWENGGKSAPFDTPFNLILNVAVGGVNGYFPDDFTYNTPKPWVNTSPSANADFWSGRDVWEPTWTGDDVAMIVDYVQMTQY